MHLHRYTHSLLAGVGLTIAVSSGRALHAQGTVSGHVTAAESKAPIEGALIMVVGGTARTSTGRDGAFTLRGVAAGNAEVQVMRIGYRSVTKAVTVTNGQTATADFELEAVAVQLQEVVTTATGVQRRIELGNAISTLSDVGQRVEERQITNVSDLLVAKTPGVVVLPTSTLGGPPTITIRGVSSISLSNAPIYYVDGVRYSSGSTSSGTDTPFSLINSLNPEEIESVEIVKGPSAATLYGTNAANGVIVITTKRGREGSARWNLYSELGVVNDRTSYQPMYANWGHAPGSTKPIRCQLATMGPNTCISDSVTHYDLLRDPERTFVHLGQRESYGLSVSGGSQAVRYFVSGNMDQEYGPIQMPGFEIDRFNNAHVNVSGKWLNPLAQKRYNFRTNVSASLSPTVDVSVNTGFSHLYNRIMPESDLIISLFYVGMQTYGFKGPGLDKITTDANGTPLNDYMQWAPGDIMQYLNEQNVDRTTTSADISWRPFSWMQNSATFGLDLSAIDFYHICHVGECPPQSPTARIGNVTSNRSNAENYSVKLLSTSAWDIRPWANLKTTLGSDYTIIQNDALNTTGTSLPPGGETVAQAATRNVGSQTLPTGVKTLGMYIQEQLALRDRLFLTLAVRNDQNSAFGSNFQRVMYPKASLSWLMSNEDFFPQYSWLNQFRLRTAYGSSGVQPGATAALITFSAGTVSIPARGLTSGTDTPALIASSPGNANLKPETSTEFEGGFDAETFNSRVRMEYTYYYRRTRDALVSVPLAPSSASSVLSMLQNVGSTRNSGHELMVTARVIDTRRFGWDVTINGSHNTNRVVNLGRDDATGLPRIIGAGGTTRQISGYPMNGQWYRGYTYHDDNGDGILQVAEVHVDSAFSYMGTLTPPDLFSIQNGFDFFGGRLHLNAMFDYKGGAKMLDGANNFQCNSSPMACRDSQDPTAPLSLQARQIAKTYGTTLNKTSYKTAAGYFVDSRFWKFREVSAVLTLPKSVTNALRAQEGATFVMAVRNIRTWSPFTGIDPEANYGVSQGQTQMEFQTAAAPTYITFRLNLKY